MAADKAVQVETLEVGEADMEEAGDTAEEVDPVEGGDQVGDMAEVGDTAEEVDPVDGVADTTAVGDMEEGEDPVAGVVEDPGDVENTT